MISCGTQCCSSSSWMIARMRIASAALFLILLTVHQGRCTSLKGQKAVFQLNAPDEYGTLSPGTSIPPLGSFTLCIDIKLRQSNRKGMTAFTYNTDTKRKPSSRHHELGIMVANSKLIIWLFQQQINVGKNISLANWHALCLTWNGQTRETHVYVNKTGVFSKTLNSDYRLGQNGSLVLGRKHSRGADRLKVDPETFVGDLYLFRLWDDAKGQQEISRLNCEDGNVITWESQQWDFIGSILENDDSLPCRQQFLKSRFKRSGSSQSQDSSSESTEGTRDTNSGTNGEGAAPSSTTSFLGTTSVNVTTSSLSSTTGNPFVTITTTSMTVTSTIVNVTALQHTADTTFFNVTGSSQSITTVNSTVVNVTPSPQVTTVNSTVVNVTPSPQVTTVNSTVVNVTPSPQVTTVNSTVVNVTPSSQVTTVNMTIVNGTFSPWNRTVNSTVVNVTPSPQATTVNSTVVNVTPSPHVTTVNSTVVNVTPSPQVTTVNSTVVNVTPSPQATTGKSFATITTSSATGNLQTNATTSPLTANSTTINVTSSAQSTTGNSFTNMATLPVTGNLQTNATTSPLTANHTTINVTSSAQNTTGNSFTTITTASVTGNSFTNTATLPVTGNLQTNATTSPLTANHTTINVTSSAQNTTGNSFTTITTASVTGNSFTNMATLPVTGNLQTNATTSPLTANSTINVTSSAQNTTGNSFTNTATFPVTGNLQTNATTSPLTANDTTINVTSSAQSTTGNSFTTITTASVTGNSFTNMATLPVTGNLQTNATTSPLTANSTINVTSSAQNTTGNSFTNTATFPVTGNLQTNAATSPLTANSTTINVTSSAQNTTGNSFTTITTASVTGNLRTNATTSPLTANSTTINVTSPAQNTIGNSFTTITTASVTGNLQTKATNSPVTADSTTINVTSSAQNTTGNYFTNMTTSPATVNITTVAGTSTPQITTAEINATDVNEIVNELENILQMESISEGLARSFINKISALINVSPADVASFSRRIIRIVDQIGEKLNFTSASINITAPSLALAVTKVNATDFGGADFSISNITNLQVALGEGSPQASFAAIKLPPSMLKNLSPEERDNASRIQFTFYEKPTLFQDPKVGNGSRLNSYIIASSVANLNISDLEDPVQITFRNIQASQDNDSVECVFWDFTRNNGSGGWNPNGCNKVQNKSNETICECNHLTHFGVLLSISRNATIDQTQSRILSYITYVGCGISSICLAMTLVTYLLFEKLRKDYPSKILINLCTALLLLNMMFLINTWISTYGIEGLCITVAVLLHYFLLVSFTWMSLEALHMYLSLVKVFNTYVHRYILKFCILGWGIPIVVVAIIVGSNPRNYGLGKYDKGTNSSLDAFCWINNDTAFYISAVGYFCIMFLVNLSMFIVVLIQLCRIKSKKHHWNAQRHVLRDMKSVAGLTFLLGITWGFAFFAWGPVNLPFMYLFTIFNTLQGTFIFIFHCAVKETVQKQWRRYLCCGKLRLSEASEWSRTATNNTKKLQPLVQGMSLSSTSNNSLQSNSSLYPIRDYSCHPIVNGSFDDKTDKYKSCGIHPSKQEKVAFEASAGLY
ncbi:adhesion G-protein coupled receptor G2-like [Scyliorhinus canicula]|uniref:adhesion G-protein coupled receptor G2-like n=1 Tax=Scyliorhinus canicula TaxID=7830 RepID=UPI0018F63F51|nr:adhesion G-protein coupled receptor G2-like [Scyliorhinus canicula]